MKPKIIKLFQHEKVIAVVPEYCSGPGWSNAVAWVHIIDYSTGKHRCEDIQPEERTLDLSVLFSPGAAIASALMSSVKTKLVKKTEGLDDLA